MVWAQVVIRHILVLNVAYNYLIISRNLSATLYFICYFINAIVCYILHDS